MPALQNVTPASAAYQKRQPRPLITLLHDAGIDARTVAATLNVHPITVWRWGSGAPYHVRLYLEQLIRVRQLEQEVAQLQALLRQRTQPIDPTQD